MTDFSKVDALFTDMDGTLTTAGRLAASTYQAMADLEAAGIPVIVVTGRPAGWAEAIHRLWPVKAVVKSLGGAPALSLLKLSFVCARTDVVTIINVMQTAKI